MEYLRRFVTVTQSGLTHDHVLTKDFQTESLKRSCDDSADFVYPFMYPLELIELRERHQLESPVRLFMSLFHLKAFPSIHIDNLDNLHDLFCNGSECD